MKAIIAKAGASGTQASRVGDLQGVATNSTAQNAAVWGETAAQTYAINDNIVYRHAINNANARAKGVQTIAQAQKFNKTNTNSQALQSKRAGGEGYSLSLSLSLV